MNQYQAPAVFIGCPVEISSDPSQSDKTLGWVCDCSGGTVSVLSINGKQHFDCWEADDPRCQTHSGVFQDFDDRGVYRISEGEIQRRHLSARMATLEGRLGELMLEIRDMAARQQVQPSAQPQEQPQEHTKRRRGRPRKQIRSAAEADALAEAEAAPVGV